MSGDVVEEVDVERMDREGEKAVRRRRREVDGWRRGVKVKRFVRVGECILGGELVGWLKVREVIYVLDADCWYPSKIYAVP